MATFTLKDAKLYVAQYDMSAHHNRITLTHDAATLDDTAFGDTFRSRISGLMNVRLDASGHFDAGAGAPDTVYSAVFAASDTVFSVFSEGGDAGEAGYTGKLLHSEFERGGSVEDLAGFTMRGDGNILVPGWSLYKGTRTSTATSTALNLGQVAAGKYLYGAIHVTAVSGTDPTLDVIIQSDDAEGFASATNRITFTQATAATSEWGTPVAGALTDSWWRISATVGGTDPSFTFIVVMGIR